MVRGQSDEGAGDEVQEEAPGSVGERARVLRVPVSGLRAGHYELDAEASHYALRVHRVAVGDVLELFDPKRGEFARARVEELPKGKRATLSVEIAAVLRADDEAQPITLLVCVAKGDKPEQALRDAVALGIETARQSGRGTLPEVIGPIPFEQALASAPGLRLACVPGEDSVPLLTALREQKGQSLSVLIGPEGGLSPSEVARLREENFVLCSLGPFVLRAELAVSVALGVAQGHLWAARSGS